eukprot:scaffold14818_cov108-Skeletonema_menzelii.AAC.1
MSDQTTAQAKGRRARQAQGGQALATSCLNNVSTYGIVQHIMNHLLRDNNISCYEVDLDS